LKPDPARVAEYRAQLEVIGPGPYIGRLLALDGDGR